MENIFWRELKDECRYCKEKESLEICKPYFDLCTDILSFIHSCQEFLIKVLFVKLLDKNMPAEEKCCIEDFIIQVFFQIW